MAKNLKVSGEQIRKYRAWVRMARAKRKAEFEKRANLLKMKYKSGGKPEWDEDAVEVNLVFPNIEIMKPSIFPRNPRFFVHAQRERFILDNGRILDGAKAASLLEDGVNYVAYATKLKRTIKQVRDDALLTTYGVIFIGYEGDMGINEEGNPYIVEDSIFAIRISPYRFLVDPEATDCYTFTDARWVAREYRILWEEFKADDWYENKDDIKPDSVGYDSKIVEGGVGGEKSVNKSIIEFAGKHYEEQDDAKRITLIEMWIKGDHVEKKKVVVFSMGGKPKAHKILPWPYKIKKMYPFRGLAFYKDNEEFYPISDIEQYWPQLEELGKIRTAQLKHVKHYGMRKIVLNVDAFESEEEIQKLEDPDAGPFIRVHVGAAGDVSKVFKVVESGSVPADMFMVDKKIADDIDKISGISDIRRGIPPPGMETGIEGKILYGAGSQRLAELKEEVGDFYEDIGRLIVQLIKQYWTIDTVVRRLGTLTPEWSEEFSAEDVAIEDDVEVDVGEAIPMDEAVKKKFALDKLELIVKGATSPEIRQKLAEEGYEIKIAEAIKDAIREYGVKNDKLITRLDPNRYVKILTALFKMKMQQQLGGGGGERSSGRAVKRRITEIPAGRAEVSSLESAAHRGLSVPGGEL